MEQNNQIILSNEKRLMEQYLFMLKKLETQLQIE